MYYRLIHGISENTLYSLPWYQIYSRIKVIQNKIYEGTLKCRFNFVKKLQLYLLNSIDSNILSIQLILKKFLVCSNKKEIKPCIFFYQERKDELNNEYKNFYYLYKLIKDQLIYISDWPKQLAKVKKSFFYISFSNFKYVDYVYKYDMCHTDHIYKFKQIILSREILYKKCYKIYFYKSILKFLLSNSKLKKNIKMEKLEINLNWYCMYNNKLNQYKYNESLLNELDLINVIKRKDLIAYLLNNNNLYNILIFESNYIVSYFLKNSYISINNILYFFLKKRYKNILYNYKNIKNYSKSFFINFYMMQKNKIYLNLFR
uniref:Reverse transcriptase N-terminal domain-containing protein n=1 Tax=Taenioma perpusillum TaxID=210852 RepID=A0A1Z1MQW0_9FLOR|nr:hypothetical protein [Taenioma perpusillum]ARW68483.1 hypothetical protein [Taenioma perpusillum]